MAALPLFFADHTPAPAWMCPTCAKPWMDELAAGLCCPTMPVASPEIVCGRCNGFASSEHAEACADEPIDLVPTDRAELVLDTTTADPESTYVPYDEDPLEEVRTIPRVEADEDDEPLYQALLGAPEGGDIEEPLLRRYHESVRAKLTERQSSLLRVYLAGKLNASRRHAFALGLPVQLVDECRAVLARRGKRGA